MRVFLDEINISIYRLSKVPVLMFLVLGGSLEEKKKKLILYPVKEDSSCLMALNWETASFSLLLGWN